MQQETILELLVLPGSVNSIATSNSATLSNASSAVASAVSSAIAQVHCRFPSWLESGAGCYLVGRIPFQN